MTIYNDNLYVAGAFFYAGGVPAKGLAKWDGNKWCSLGIETDQLSTRLATANNGLYIGGCFSKIDTAAFSHVAEWNGGNYTKSCGPAELVSVDEEMPLLYPNPSTRHVYINLAGAKSINIYDAVGRLVQTVSETEIPNGIDVGGLAAGMYLVTIRDAANVVHRAKLIKS